MRFVLACHYMYMLLLLQKAEGRKACLKHFLVLLNLLKAELFAISFDLRDIESMHLLHSTAST
jgi:hypothetical protein